LGILLKGMAKNANDEAFRGELAQMMGSGRRSWWAGCLAIAAAMLALCSAVQARRAATVCVISPQPEEIVNGPDVAVAVAVEGVDIRPGCNSLHVALDNEPFAVVYNLRVPYRIHDVAPGTHTLRVYAANPYHEIIRGTLCVVPFAVQYHDGENRPERGEPLLTYVLPQGEYRGIDCADVVLNFDVSGTPLSRYGYRVQYYVDGRRYITWRTQSEHLRGLAPGYHTIRMELVDEHGRVVPGPLNAVERTILLSPEKSLEKPRKGEVPVIDSIHGPMTGGRPWVAREEEPSGKEEMTEAGEAGEAGTITVRGAQQVARAKAEARAKTSSGEKAAAFEETLSVAPTEEQTTGAATEAVSNEEEGATGASRPAKGREGTKSSGSATTPTLKARRVTLKREAPTTRSTTTLKAVAVSTTHTEMVRATPSPTTAATTRVSTQPVGMVAPVRPTPSPVPSPAATPTPSPTPVSADRGPTLPQGELQVQPKPAQSVTTQPLPTAALPAREVEPARSPADTATTSVKEKATTTAATMPTKIDRVIGGPAKVDIVEGDETDAQESASAIAHVIGSARGTGPGEVGK
jgi:hypothetical protein